MLKKAFYTSNALRIDSSISTAALAAAIRPGMAVIARPGSIIRAAFPTCANVTYDVYGATVLGSEALPVGGATLVSGTRYKIATSLHRPNTGGTTNSIYLYTNGAGYDGSTPTPVPRNSTNSSTTGTNAWAMPGDGFLYFDLGRAVTANDVFEMPQRVCVSAEDPGMHVYGGTWRHSEGHLFALNQTRSFSGFEVGYVDAGWTSSDVLNATLGTAYGLAVHDSTFHDAQSDGGGGGDLLSFHGVAASGAGGCIGDIERMILRNGGKCGITNSEKGIVTYHDILFDGAVCNIYNDAGSDGAHTFTRIRMMNEWPNVTAAGTHGFWILPSLRNGSVVNVDGLSIYRGTGSTNALRAFRAQSGTVVAKNIVVDSHGASTPFSIGFMQSAASWTESNCAAGGNTTNFDASWGAGTNDLTLASTPFNGAGSGDLSPNSLILGKGTGGGDIGYTRWPI